MDSQTDSDRKPDSQESLILFSQETYEGLVLSQGTHDLLFDIMEPIATVDETPSTIQCKQPVTEETSSFNYEGPYNFSVSFKHEGEHVTKSCPWTYSNLLDKLYMKMDHLCPFLVTVSSTPPPGSVIRASMYYKKEEHSALVPHRCPAHSIPGDSSNYGFNELKHLIRSDVNTAKYEVHQSGRTCVIVPFSPAGLQRTLVNLKIMCCNSCEGGLGRRPTVLVLSLENNMGVTLGRFCVEVRICSCPGRDRNIDDKRELDRRNSSSSTHHSTLGRDTKRAAHLISSSNNAPTKKLRTEQYELTVTSKRVYNVLKSLRDILEAEA